MPGLIEQILGLATIEQIEAEQATHRAAIAESQKQLDALDQVLRILIVARDGKPAKTWSRKRGASKLDATPAPVAVEPGDEDSEGEGDSEESPSLTANQQAVIGLLKRSGPLTIGEISHGIKVVYSTAHAAAQKLLDQKLIVKSGDKLALKV